MGASLKLLLAIAVLAALAVQADEKAQSLQLTTSFDSYDVFQTVTNQAGVSGKAQAMPSEHAVCKDVAGNACVNSRLQCPALCAQDLLGIGGILGRILGLGGRRGGFQGGGGFPGNFGGGGAGGGGGGGGGADAAEMFACSYDCRSSCRATCKK